MGRFLRLVQVGLVGGFLATSAAANATVMTFETGSNITINGYSESGMTVSSATSYARVGDWTADGDREVIRNSLDSNWLFSLTSGDLFDLVSLDIEAPSGSIVASGLMRVTASNGSFVDIGGASFGTFAFGIGFSGISDFSISGLSGQQTFDNITWNSAQVTGPGGLALFGLGLAGLGFSHRKKKTG